MSDIRVQRYNLPGGSIAEVHKVFGDQFYFAIVEQKGRYPEEGKIAHDIGRTEYVYVIEGEIYLTVNNQKKHLNKGDAFLIENEDYYFLEGTATLIVFVKDETGGTSAIETLTELS